MIRSSKSQAVQPRKQKAQFQASSNVRHRLRDTRAALAVQAVYEGNSDADWQLWEDSVIASESLFQSVKDRFAHVDAFAAVYHER